MSAPAAATPLLSRPQPYPAGTYLFRGQEPPAPPPPGWGWDGAASCPKCNRLGAYLGPRGHHCPDCEGAPGAPQEVRP